MAKISCRKFSEILKRPFLQNSFKKAYVLESIFNWVTRIDSIPATLRKKTYHQRNFPEPLSEFSVLLQRARS